jgi:hypothetical protein
MSRQGMGFEWSGGEMSIFRGRSCKRCRRKKSWSRNDRRRLNRPDHLTLQIGLRLDGRRLRNSLGDVWWKLRTDLPPIWMMTCGWPRPMLTIFNLHGFPVYPRSLKKPVVTQLVQAG